MVYGGHGPAVVHEGRLAPVSLPSAAGLDATNLRTRLAVVTVVLTILAGCSSVPIPPTYTQEELKAICERTGGWWRPDGLTGGFCEQFP